MFQSRAKIKEEQQQQQQSSIAIESRMFAGLYFPAFTDKIAPIPSTK
jgi:hypothetical protein